MRILLVSIILFSFASDGYVFAAETQTKELIVWGAWKRKGLDAAFRRFEQEHPGWRVMVSTAAGAGQMDPQKLMCGIAGGDPPDTLVQDRLSIAEWAARDAFSPLDDLIAGSQEQERLARLLRTNRSSSGLNDLVKLLQAQGASRQLTIAKQLQDAAIDKADALADELVALCQAIHADQFYNTCWNEACFGTGDQRHVYGIPNTTDVRALYYNEDLLERARLVDSAGKARPPADWNELREYASKLTEHDARGNIVRLGFAPLYSQGFLYHYGWLNGGEFLSPDGRRCTFADPRNIEALQYIRSVYDDLGGIERVASFQSTFQSEELDAFLTGKIAMKVDSDFVQNTIAEYSPSLRFAVCPLPAPTGKKPMAWSGGFAWVIPAGARHREMAFELIRFLTTDRVWQLRATVESRIATSRGRYFMPELAPLPHVNRDVYERFVRDDPNLPPRFKRSSMQFIEMMNISRYRPVTPAGQLMWDEQLRAPEKALRNRATPTEALVDAEEAVQEQLDAIYSPARGTVVNLFNMVLTAMTVVGMAMALIYSFRRRKRGGFSRGSRNEAMWGYLFASPWLVGMIALTAGPVIASFIYSLCRYDVLHPAEFIGIDNYHRLLTRDPLFWKSLANTAFMILGIPLGMAVGLTIAMLLNQQLRGMRVYRTVFYLPAIVPVVASSLLWLWVLNPQVGLLNSLLRICGVADPPRWLASPSWLFGSKTAIIIMGLWSAGASMVIWLAGLKGIPQHLYESAEIDGAGPWRKFLNVTLPMLSPYIFFNLVTGIIGTMQIFSQAYIMTKGGPDDSTMFYAYYLFNSAFRYFRMGYASAMAWILFLIVLLLTLLQLGLGKRWVHYDTV